MVSIRMYKAPAFFFVENLLFLAFDLSIQKYLFIFTINSLFFYIYYAVVWFNLNSFEKVLGPMYFTCVNTAFVGRNLERDT